MEVGVVAPVTAVFEGTAPLSMEVGVVAPVTAGFYGFLLPFLSRLCTILLREVLPTNLNL